MFSLAIPFLCILYLYFNFLSVSVYVTPIRPSLNLLAMGGQKPITDSPGGSTQGQGQGPHYLALDHRPSHICTDLIDKVINQQPSSLVRL